MKQFFNVINKDILLQTINDYNSRLHYDSATMNKCDPGDSLKIFTPIIQNLIGYNIIYKSGNFYKHKCSYLPHTDYKINQDNTLNVVIPLWYNGDRASLIVFDQQWHKNSVTWCLNGPVYKFITNTGIPGNPNDYKDVLFKTNKAIDTNFYNQYLHHYPQNCFWGLSGNAFPFEPGSVILFDNRNIHCTSVMYGEKLGISLRYKI